MSKGRRPIGANLKALFRGVDVSPAGSGIVSMHGAKPRRTRGGDAPLTRSRDGRASAPVKVPTLRGESPRQVMFTGL